jgi:hypothetical protein
MQKRFQILLVVSFFIIFVTVVGFTYRSKGQAMPVVQNQASPSSQPTQQQSDPTAAWKTYSNAELGYSIKYPPEYRVAVLPSSADVLGMNRFAGQLKRGIVSIESFQPYPDAMPSHAQMTIGIFNNPRRLSLQEWVNQNFTMPWIAYQKELAHENIATPQFKEMRIGSNADLVSGDYPVWDSAKPPGRIPIVFIISRDGDVIALFSGYPYTKEFDTMLATLQFTY